MPGSPSTLPPGQGGEESSAQALQAVASYLLRCTTPCPAWPGCSAGGCSPEPAPLCSSSSGLRAETADARGSLCRRRAVAPGSLRPHGCQPLTASPGLAGRAAGAGGGGKDPSCRRLSQAAEPAARPSWAQEPREGEGAHLCGCLEPASTAPSCRSGAGHSTRCRAWDPARPGGHGVQDRATGAQGRQGRDAARTGLHSAARLWPRAITRLPGPAWPARAQSCRRAGGLQRHRVPGGERSWGLHGNSRWRHVDGWTDPGRAHASVRSQSRAPPGTSPACLAWPCSYRPGRGLRAACAICPAAPSSAEPGIGAGTGQHPQNAALPRTHCGAGRSAPPCTHPSVQD